MLLILPPAYYLVTHQFTNYNSHLQTPLSQFALYSPFFVFPGSFLTVFWPLAGGILAACWQFTGLIPRSEGQQTASKRPADGQKTAINL
jgi:hypothetical protein